MATRPPAGWSGRVGLSKDIRMTCGQAFLVQYLIGRVFWSQRFSFGASTPTTIGGNLLHFTSFLPCLHCQLHLSYDTPSGYSYLFYIVYTFKTCISHLISYDMCPQGTLSIQLAVMGSDVSQHWTFDGQATREYHYRWLTCALLPRNRGETRVIPDRKKLWLVLGLFSDFRHNQHGSLFGKFFLFYKNSSTMYSWIHCTDVVFRLLEWK